MSEYIESLTMYASNACTEVLSGIEHQLERTLQGPCKKVAEKVARLTEERDTSALSKVDGVIRTALGLLQEASPVLATAKAGLEKLGRFLEKVCHCHLPFSPHEADQLGGARDCSLGCSPRSLSHARLPFLWH